MIFAKLDVCVWRHERFIQAGPTACGYWMAALAWLREDSSSDGYISPTAAGMLLKIGDRKARNLSQRLVEVGLFEAKGDGYVLLGYTEKNETRDQIEARRAESRARTSAHRASRRAGNGVHAEQGNALPTRVTPNTGNAKVPGSDSDSGSVSSGSPRSEISAPPTVIQNGKAEPGSGTVRRAEILRTVGEPEIEQNRAKALADLERLASDPSFAVGGPKR
jgi:hypothetical protein